MVHSEELLAERSTMDLVAAFDETWGGGKHVVERQHDLRNLYWIEITCWFVGDLSRPYGKYLSNIKLEFYPEFCRITYNHYCLMKKTSDVDSKWCRNLVEVFITKKHPQNKRLSSSNSLKRSTVVGLVWCSECLKLKPWNPFKPPIGDNYNVVLPLLDTLHFAQLSSPHTLWHQPINHWAILHSN